MLKRVYIHNFRAFVNFEYTAGSKQLLIGSNGSGKSSFVDAVSVIRYLVVVGDRPNEALLLQRTRWLTPQPQVFELEAMIEGDVYVYRVQIEEQGNPGRPVLTQESVTCAGTKLFEFAKGELALFSEQGSQVAKLPFDGQRSAFGVAGPSNQKLMQFHAWLAEILIFRLNPFAMLSVASGESSSPSVDLSNFASWYRHLTQSFPVENAEFTGAIRDVLPGFSVFKLDLYANNNRLLMALFASEKGQEVRFAFQELSEGQRSLVCLYAILHFSIKRGATVIIDEPENFIALRELQPWLMAVADAVERRGQVLLISHHPEFINQWLPDYGVQFFRTGAEPVRVKKFEADSNEVLAPAELIARGWEND